eukprot:gnl/TRDRNA2_/TRDRNA2_80886_c0_seq1.p1 gnl/TRDRNA2_/TRDRNA2_80886_c0~~gnl/TRDRNA2_/TRDRNA2_80886_c0_seq1.p1  ORF type:complete len:296 (+),score=37.59 gnl/TRDRNA2_/TRDRNA2_80886_c0_seq1:147-1034(+)
MAATPSADRPPLLVDRCTECWESLGMTRVADVLRGDRGGRRRAHGCTSAEREARFLEDSESEEPEYRVRVDGFEVARRGRHVVYSLTVVHGAAHWSIRRRFRQVMALHTSLIQGLGRSALAEGLPRPPPKVTFRSLLRGPSDHRFLEVRAVHMQRYINELLRYIPYVDQCEALHDFLCSVDVNSMNYDALLDLGQAIGRADDSERRVDPAAIAALPRRCSDSRGAANADGEAGAAERCVVCQDAMEDTEDVRILPCGHQYHFKCIAEWIRQSNTCCVCQCVAVVSPPVDSDLSSK